MTNTRHIPDLQAARECISQAIIAAKRHDSAFVDQSVNAALQYLQPDVEHVKDEEPSTSTRTVELAVSSGKVYRLRDRSPSAATEIHRTIVNLKSLRDPTARFQIDTEGDQHRVIEVFVDHIVSVDIQDDSRGD